MLRNEVKVRGNGLFNGTAPTPNSPIISIPPADDAATTA
jgi:hypothetical protein